MPTYLPPPLNRRIVLRNPADRPATEAGRYDQPGAATWGVRLWANRRDRALQARVEEGVQIHQISTVWTIRDRAGIAPDAEIVSGGQVFRAIGPPVERGGPQGGRRARYLEIHTVLRV